MRQRLLAAIGGGARAQGLHRREVNFDDSMEGGALRGIDHLCHYRPSLASEVLNCHRQMLFLVELLERFDISRTRINNDYFCACHARLLCSSPTHGMLYRSALQPIL